MNWAEIKKGDLIKSVQVLGLVPQRAGVPSSDFIKVTLRKKSVEMSLSSTVTAVVRTVYLVGALLGTDFFIDKNLLSAFVLGGKGWKGNFRVAVDESRFYIRQGSRHAEFAMRQEPLGGYGTWRDRNGLKEVKLSDELRNLLLASNSCSTGDPSLPHLNCVYIGGHLVLSTNLIALFVGIRQKEDGLRIPFPVGIIPLLGGELVDSVGVDGDRVILDCGCGYVEGTVSAIAKKNFPKQNLVESVKKARLWPLLAKIPSERLSEMIQRLVTYLSSVKREDWLVELELGNGKVKASVKVQQGKFEESMEVEDLKVEGSVVWPLEQVKPVLDYMATAASSVKIRVDEKKKTPYLLSGGRVEMMVARKLQ